MIGRDDSYYPYPLPIKEPKKRVKEEKDEYTFDPTEVAQTFLKYPMKVIPVRFRDPSESQKDNTYFAINTGTNGSNPVIVFKKDGGYETVLGRDIFGRGSPRIKSDFDIGVPCEISFP
jgi:hypothetical protein